MLHLYISRLYPVFIIIAAIVCLLAMAAADLNVFAWAFGCFLVFVHIAVIAAAKYKDKLSS